MDYAPLYRLLTSRRDGLDADAMQGWRARELMSLGFLVAHRLARGTLLRLRMDRASGLVLCDRRVRVLYGFHVSAGRDLNLEEGCLIVGLARRGVVFGDRCTVGRFAMICPTNALGGEPGEGLRVGDHSNIGPFAYVGCSGFIEIGDRVLMGPRVTLLAENHVFDDAGLHIKDQGVVRSTIRVEDDCWLGAGSTIVAGVTIGHGSVVAAGSVVTRDVPPQSVVAGVPAKVVRSRNASR